eukprot:2919048-Heterocapsa_arctica.AAC.1
MYRQQLDQVTDTCSDAQRVLFIRHRHNDSATMLCAFDDMSQAICVQAGQGDMQGDVPAPQQFSIAYDKFQENMAEDGITFLGERIFTFLEPVGHTQHVADHIRYADDLLTLGLAN